ncbi:OmpA family protein [Cesiribacter andamanensis]|uniref:Photosystem I chlorophyll a apoprotein n=1 Tax=Cesiribacter andamanensis AMV16 TaxID=1279009 RepID=M7MXV5_9BACT|nr:OmpA family protein [Cesiribacter andamanensis]EMR01258.1 Photosystem I chlorophyll a apoprotein [Cesiribacter andamanensis AMV16]
MRTIYSIQTPSTKGLAALLLLCLLQLAALAQQPSQTVYRAEKLFEIGNYADALKGYQEAIQAGEGSPYLLYKAGRCYLESKQFAEKIKALPLLQQAAPGADKLPAEYQLALGDAFYVNARPLEALQAYERYQKLVAKDAAKQKTVKERKAQAQLAQEHMSNAKQVALQPLQNGVNTEFTEYNPVVSADESLMAYTLLKPADSRSSQKALEQIMLVKKEGGSWSAPQPLKVSNFNAGTAGLSADGQQMIIYLQDNTGGNLYLLKRSGDSWGKPQEMPGDLNSRFVETTASITPDGKTIYFASNRPGGRGGMDIYKTELQPNGSWGRAQNLGPQINTEADEDAPFIHPDGRTLYFTSNGRGSLGGNDVFRTHLLAGQWSIPQNMGYPINTVANESYFTLTADGSRAYFSTDRPGGRGEQDIYTFSMPEQDRNIPLTMIKGRILAGEREQPVPTKIFVVDVQTGNKLEYVYHPDPKTGNYLIILPPGRNYDLIVKAEGYLPYSINVNIPNQDYFHELYQQIFLRPIKQFDVVVGQEVKVQNAFYDTGQPLHHDLKKIKESTMVKGDSIDVYEMMETIIGAGDKAAYEYLLELMYTVNPIENVDFSAANNRITEDAEAIYYYEENDKTKLEAKKVGNETIYTLPTLRVTEASKMQAKSGGAPYRQELLKPVYKIYFDVDSKTLKPADEQKLQEIIRLFESHEQLGVEISGYASKDGNAEHNRTLSNERAIAVLDYFNKRGVGRRRIVAKGLGATTNQETNAQEGRRVEVRIIDLSQASK